MQKKILSTNIDINTQKNTVNHKKAFIIKKEKLNKKLNEWENDIINLNSKEIAIEETFIFDNNMLTLISEDNGGVLLKAYKINKKDE